MDGALQGDLARILKVLHSNGVPLWINYALVEAVANVALFVPFGAAALLAQNKPKWWQIGVMGLVVSCCFELGQLIFLHNRYASPLDVAANTAGALLGASLVLAAHRAFRQATDV